MIKTLLFFFERSSLYYLFFIIDCCGVHSFFLTWKLAEIRLAAGGRQIMLALSFWQPSYVPLRALIGFAFLHCTLGTTPFLKAMIYLREVIFSQLTKAIFGNRKASRIRKGVNLSRSQRLHCIIPGSIYVIGFLFTRPIPHREQKKKLPQKSNEITHQTKATKKILGIIKEFVEVLLKYK